MQNILEDYLPDSATEYCDVSNIGSFDNSECDLNIIHINICGLKKNFNKLSCFLEVTQINNAITVVSETHHNNNIDDFQIRNYNIFYSPINKYDGTLVYDKSDLVTNQNVIVINSSNLLSIKCTKNNKSIGLIAHYCLPSLL